MAAPRSPQPDATFRPLRVSGWSLLGVVVAWAVCGCSSAPEGGTATGTVLLDGQPLAGAVVQLWPWDDLRLGVYGGRTDAAGRITFHLAEGQRIKPGRYVLLVAKQAPRPLEKPSRPREEEQLNVLSGPEGFRNLLPAVYSDKARSPFTVEICAVANELPPVELRSRPGQ